MSYVLGAWGKRADGGCAAPVYESATNACKYWLVVEPHPLTKVVLWRVSAKVATLDGEQVATALKDTVGKARGWAERWVQQQQEQAT